MKKLFLIRHAKASWEHPEQPDYDRPLTEQGQNDATTMAEQLKTLGTHPDLIISSSAERALRTAHIMAKQLEFPAKKIVTDIHIYTGGVEELIEIIKAFDAKLKTVLFFGHNPSLTWLAHYLCEGTRMNIATCGILTIGFDMPTWEDLVNTEGQFLNYIHPHHEHALHHDEST